MGYIDDNLKNEIKNTIDKIIEPNSSGGLSSSCTIVFPPKYVRCNNCLIDPVSGRSIGRYRHGGPSPFTGKCPLCNGNASIAEEVTDTVNLVCVWDIRKFLLPVKSVAAPNEVVQIKGFWTDAPKILKAQFIILALPTEPYIRKKFKLSGELVDINTIVQGRYFHAILERAE